MIFRESFRQECRCGGSTSRRKTDPLASCSTVSSQKHTTKVLAACSITAVSGKIDTMETMPPYMPEAVHVQTFLSQILFSSTDSRHAHCDGQPKQHCTHNRTQQQHNDSHQQHWKQVYISSWPRGWHEHLHAYIGGHPKPQYESVPSTCPGHAHGLCETHTPNR